MLTYRGGRLQVEAVPVARLAKTFGTPLYVYSKRALLDRVQAIRTAFSDLRPLVCYALKANSNGAICALLARQGLGAEAVSGGELRRALSAGFPPASVVLSGIGKRREELETAVVKRVLSINVESEAELGAIEQVARGLRRRAPVSVRLNPDVDAHTHAYVTTGTAESKFGVDERCALSMYRRAARSRHLLVRGIHCHIGSQITSVAPYEKAALKMRSFLRVLKAEGIVPGFVDVGGGMGIDHRSGRELDLRSLCGTFQRVLGGDSHRLIIEPGRYIVSAAGVLLTTALFRKKTTKEDFVVVDAGMNDLIRPALYGSWHGIVPERASAAGGKAVDVVGPVCESVDVLARGARVGRCREGDVLAVRHAGAYGFSMSSQYNSRPRPAEVLVDGRGFALIRKRETFRDLVRNELRP